MLHPERRERWPLTSLERSRSVRRERRLRDCGPMRESVEYWDETSTTLTSSSSSLMFLLIQS